MQRLVFLKRSLQVRATAQVKGGALVRVGPLLRKDSQSWGAATLSATQADEAEKLFGMSLRYEQ